MKSGRGTFCSIFLFGTRFIVGGILIFSSLSKLLDLNAFAVAIENFQILPVFFVPVLTFLLPPIELFLGIILIIGLYPFYTGLLVCFLFFIFSTAILINLLRGNTPGCGCFGDFFHSSVSIELLLLDLSLFIIMFLYAYSERREYKNKFFPDMRG